MDQPATRMEGQPARDPRRFRWAVVKFAVATVAMYLAPFFVPLGAVLAVLVTALAVPPTYFFRRAQFRRQLWRAGFCASFLALCIGLEAANKSLAESRLELLVDAVHAYQADHGDYPGDLADLTPAYIDHIPRATLWPYNSEFSWKEKRFLGCNTLPPFGTIAYDFETESRMSRG